MTFEEWWKQNKNIMIDLDAATLGGLIKECCKRAWGFATFQSKGQQTAESQLYCELCGGYGTREVSADGTRERQECERCSGTGLASDVIELPFSADGFKQRSIRRLKKSCIRCKGVGMVTDSTGPTYQCFDCKGKGFSYVSLCGQCKGAGYNVKAAGTIQAERINCTGCEGKGYLE